jgi:hydroxymethylpyrimidine pyrophosphatase-like HAD family hydrolase
VVKLSRIRYVLTDIDDALTHEGLLPSRTYLAIERLHKAGFKVIPVTAGSSRWCNLIARMWPVDAVIGENGGLYFLRGEARNTIIRSYWSAEPIETHFISAHVVDTVIGLICSLMLTCSWSGSWASYERIIGGTTNRPVRLPPCAALVVK